MSTDNHVGYAERDGIRDSDSFQTFDEIMGMASEHDVDMVLLAGDLFHDNKPSTRSYNEVLKSLRRNCLGDKPCELQLLSDSSENFQGTFNHVNYEDEDINVAIPVFSIHGNHDDPSGEGHLAALDLLSTAGYMNYYGRTPESDNIVIKPVLLQKGRTKLALYGMSNVRDERLFRTFRAGRVKIYQPSQQKDEWFNLMSVHQNHAAHTDTGYLPENFLPEFLDLVVWGHEHECLIHPRYNPEMGFHVMQPGSSIATSLMPGEAVPKHVAILEITGKEFKCIPVPLKTVRPFVMREIVLANEREMKNIWKKAENRSEITRYLIKIVDEMIEEANQNWRSAQEDLYDESGNERAPPLPLIRLRVEYTAPEGRFDLENPQRFSGRFIGRLANIKDVVSFHKRKTGTKKSKNEVADLPDEAALARRDGETIKIEKIVREFLKAQSLIVLPTNSFGDALGQFVDKDDKGAMDEFVEKSLNGQIQHLLGDEEMNEDDVPDAMDKYRSLMESQFAAGVIKNRGGRKYKPKPDGWDTDMDGEWEEQPGAVDVDVDGGSDQIDEEAEEEPAPVAAKAPATRGRGQGRGRAPARGGAASTRGKAAAKPAAKKPAARGKKAVVEEDDDDEPDDDIVMIDDEDEDDESQSQSQALFVKQPSKPAPKKAVAATAARQSKLNFSQSQAPSRSAQPARTAKANGRKNVMSISDDDISEDDDDAFETPPPIATSRGSTTSRRR